ncbi:type II CAAX endopeptidase family protein [Spirulina sp. CS-785/01]|uniref:CPBP family intramembrane glutamic endopeptidase n=1 Tax=Spirulina sp. CS-785/01 TaxID=3021716 RepID=UPI00232D7D34|nr:type II CAAX endopeptidase family protein [Spirulina sp. CS-785/01]MDB9315124.1 type II CAAX endopeptidase family protein [Spirulina sp. CS-785/01]
MAIANPFSQFKSRWLFLASLVLIFLSSFLFGFLSVIFNLQESDPIVTYIFSIFVFGTLCLWILFVFRFLHIKFTLILGEISYQYNWFFLLILTVFLIIFSLGSALVSYSIVYAIAPQWMDDFLQSLALQDQAQSQFPLVNKILEVLVLIIVAPMTEEFVFRGVLLHRWATKWGLIPSIFTTSLLFGIGHINPVGLTMVGIILCILYLKSKSLIIPIVAHGLNNGIVVIIRFFSETYPVTEPQPLQETFTNWQNGLVLMAVSSPFLLYYIYKNFPSPSTPLPYLANQIERL